MSTKIEISEPIRPSKTKKKRVRNRNKKQAKPVQEVKAAPKRRTRYKNRQRDRNEPVPSMKDRMHMVNYAQNSQCDMDYIKTLLYPEEFSFRPPDQVSQPTSLYRSVREITLYANVDGTAASGRFSCAVQPKLGGIDSPLHYQIGIVNNQGDWPQDFSQPASYVVGEGGSDPRVDPNVPSLTYPPVGNSQYTAVGFSSDTTNFNTWNDIVPNLSAAFNVRHTLVNTREVPAENGLGTYVNNRGGTGKALVLPCGAYTINANLLSLGTFSGGSWKYSFGIAVFDKTGQDLRGLYYKGHSITGLTAEYRSGYCEKSTFFEISDSHTGQIYDANQGSIAFF